MGFGPGISNISVIIPTDWKRKKELEAVVEHLKKVGFTDINLVEGKKRMYNRYEGAAKAKHDIIYTQDDDCIIRNIDALINEYDPEKITANCKLQHIDFYERETQSRVCLVGFGAIFHKSLLKNLDKYLDKYGESDHLYREADRVFTWVNEKQLILADTSIEDFPSAMEGMSVVDTDHFDSMRKMVEKLKTL